MKKLLIICMIFASLISVGQVETVSLGELPKKDTLFSTDRIFVEDDSAYSYYANLDDLFNWISDSISASIPMTATTSNYHSTSGSEAVAFVELNIWNDTLFLGDARTRSGNQVYVARTDYENSVVITGTPGIYYKSAGYTSLWLSKTMVGALVQSDGNAWYLIGIWYDPYYRTTLAVFPDSTSIGGVSAKEKLTVSGAVNIGNTTSSQEGSIKYDGSNFKGYDGTSWSTFGGWDRSGNYLSTATSADSVGIGTDDPIEKLDVFGNINIPNTSTSVGNIKQNGSVLFHTYGTYNYFLGLEAGNYTLDSISRGNTGLGSYAMHNLDSGNTNVAVGDHALFNVGKRGLSSCNVALGASALRLFEKGYDNIGIGSDALYNLDSASGNISIGIYSSFDKLYGSHNTVIGHYSMYNNTDGYYNTTLGAWSGYNNEHGHSNIFIGDSSGYNETGSYKLYMDITSTATPLIWGDFNADTARINGGFSVKNHMSIEKGLKFPLTTSATVGVITMDGNRFIHAYKPASNDGSNLFMGSGAGNFTMASTTAGQASYNNGFGESTLRALTTGFKNNAFGFSSLVSNTTGSANSAYGNASLYGNTIGKNNTGIGYQSGFANVSSSGNTSIGYNSLFSNTGEENTAVGLNAGLYLNAKQNTLIGAYAGYGSSGNTTGDANTFIGYFAGFYARSGENNTGVGFGALYSNSGNGLTGSGNTALGRLASGLNRSGSYNTALGYNAGYSNLTGSYNIFLGNEAGYNETGAYKLYVDVSNTATPLIHGDFNTDQLWLNSSYLQIGGTESSHTYTLFVDGTTCIDDLLKLNLHADPPGSPTEGMIYADTDHHLYYYNGTTWVQLD